MLLYVHIVKVCSVLKGFLFLDIFNLIVVLPGRKESDCPDDIPESYACLLARKGSENDQNLWAMTVTKRYILVCYLIHHINTIFIYADNYRVYI